MAWHWDSGVSAIAASILLQPASLFTPGKGLLLAELLGYAVATVHHTTTSHHCWATYKPAAGYTTLNSYPPPSSWLRMQGPPRRTADHRATPRDFKRDKWLELH